MHAPLLSLEDVREVPDAKVAECGVFKSCDGLLWGGSGTEDFFRSLPVPSPSFPYTRRRFRPDVAHDSPAAGILVSALLVSAIAFPSMRAFSAASRCLRYAPSCSAVSLCTCSSFALVLSRTLSRKSTSSSSSVLNWFLSLIASSNASCLAA